MDRSLLFPFDIEKDNPQAYFFALELARKMRYNLKIIHQLSNIKSKRAIFRKSEKDQVLASKKKLHLALLEFHGLYLNHYNQWEFPGNIRIKTIIRVEPVVDTILSILQRKKNSYLLCDYNYFITSLLPSRLINANSKLNYKLWLMPAEINNYKVEAGLENEEFKLRKKELFDEQFMQTRLFKLPDDLSLIHTEFRSPVTI